jgi:hypothetical protein
MNLSEFAQDGSILTEINMSPSSLKQLASNINATVGIEFEMIVRDAMSAGSDDYELVPDYSNDERAYSIDDIVEFFDDGDYNSRGEVNNLREELSNAYTEWVDEALAQEWSTSKISYIKDWIVENASRDEIVEKLGIDVDDPEFVGVSRSQMQDLAELISDDYNSLWYELAYEAFREEQMEDDSYSETEFLRDQRLRHMSDVSNNYDIAWPHWNADNNDEDREANGERVAGDFSSVVGRPARYFNNYHRGDRGSQRKEGFYIVEPDGSLHGSSDDDAGLEFVSPPLSLPEMLKELPQVVAWGKENAYTDVGTGCGLHMNVSIDGVDQKSQLDYVKLALLLGDEYVLREFDRLGNSYCKSALTRVRSHTKMLTPEKMTEIMTNMRQGLNKLASQVIHSGSTEKFTSINNKGNYIEFRSPGGDWLEEDLGKLTNTLLRFVVALDAANDPNKYRDEYAKKLYKTLSPSEDGTNTIKYFSEFSAGKLPRSALVSFVRQARLQRKGVDPTEGMPMWLVSTRNDQYQTFVKAADTAGAIEAARHKLGLADPMSRSMYGDNSFEVQQRNTPIQARVSAGPAEPAFPSSTQDVQQNRPQSFTGNWKIVAIPADGDPQIIHVLMDIGPNQSDANRAAADWIQANRDSVADLIRGAEITVLPSRV